MSERLMLALFIRLVLNSWEDEDKQKGQLKMMFNYNEKKDKAKKAKSIKYKPAKEKIYPKLPPYPKDLTSER